MSPGVLIHGWAPPDITRTIALGEAYQRKKRQTIHWSQRHISHYDGCFFTWQELRGVPKLDVPGTYANMEPQNEFPHGTVMAAVKYFQRARRSGASLYERIRLYWVNPHRSPNEPGVYKGASRHNESRILSIGEVRAMVGASTMYT